MKMPRVDLIRESDGEYLGQVSQRMKHGTGTRC